MKIIVLAGGLSTERDVSLASAAGICNTLLEKGHDAFLLDVFLGLENAPENLEDVFTLPGSWSGNRKEYFRNRAGSCSCKSFPSGSV